tara:strand:+ start:8060 stop:9280 length:1221 start_codon:yes stop_codon:yes gene_type:complete
MNISYPAILIIVFVFSGLIKWIPLPADVTLLSLIALILIFFSRLRFFYFRERLCSRDTMLCYLLFLLYFVVYCISILYSSSTGFWMEKTQGIFLSIIALSLPIILLKGTQDFIWLENTLLVFMVLASFILMGLYLTGFLDYFIYQGVGSGNDNSESLIPDYLVVGTLLSIGILICIQRGGIYYLLGSLSLLCILLIGSRGPLLFVIVCSIILYLFSRYSVDLEKRRMKLSSQLIRFTGTSLLLFVSLYLGFSLGGDDSTFVRIALMFTDPEELAQTFRVEEFTIATEVIRENPLFGVGLGAYGIEAYGADFNVYPHNLVLESASELGLPSIILFLLGFLFLFYRCSYLLWDKSICLFLAILIFELMNFMKSGGFVSSRELYLFAGILLARIDFINYQNKLSNYENN